jgi:hypothetical protein
VVLAGEHAPLREQPVHWMLIDLARRALPELDESSRHFPRAARQSEQCSLMSAVSKATDRDVQLDLPKRSDFLRLGGH